MRQLCNVAYVAQAEAVLVSEDDGAYAKWEAELNAPPRREWARRHVPAAPTRPVSRVDPQLLRLMGGGR